MAHEGLIAEKAQFTISKLSTRIGIFSDAEPTWSWYVGCSGKIQWMVSDKDLPARTDTDPPWLLRSSTELGDLPQVEVLLVQGRWPEDSDRIWKASELMIALQVVKKPIASRGTGKRKRSNPIPLPKLDGWDYGSYVLKHNAIGGVTNQSYLVRWRVRSGCRKPVFSFPPNPSNCTLKRCLVGATLKGIQVAEPTDHKLNTEKGLMVRSQLSEDVVVQSVYGSWMKRKLTTQEQANILDFPVDRTVEMTDEELLVLTRKEIPGKVLTAASWFLKEWNPNYIKDETSDNPISSEDNPPTEGFEPKFKKTDLSYLDLQLEAKLLRYQEEREDGVVKDDDAAIPVHLWNNRIAIGLNRIRRERLDGDRPANDKPYFSFSDDKERTKFSGFLGTFRKLLQPKMLKRWKFNVRDSFEIWYETTGKHMLHATDILADGLKACDKADGASWWDWDAGSALLFWRWPPDYVEIARVGIAPMFDSEPPTNRDKQPPYDEDEVRNKVKAKLEKVLAKGYIELVDIELVEAMMFMFHVDKGTKDIRLVYDGTRSGLNESIHAPWFALPTIDSMSRWVIAGAWLADNDYGEMFLNFPLHPDLRKYCGVDLSQLFPELIKDGKDSVIGQWMRNAMGLRGSPYASVQGCLRAKRHIMGDPNEVGNPFEWSHIELNLPCSKDYDATKPWIMKMRADGDIASEVVQYVDDVRIIAATRELAWLCSSKMAKGLCYLGLQDAARKRREPSQRPGAWAGATVMTEGKAVCKGVTKERWTKLQAKIRWIGKQLDLSDAFSKEADQEMGENNLESAESPLHFKSLESNVGFIVYVAMTYTSMIPYLKGIYLTLNSWRGNRNKDGWKDTKKRKRDLETDQASPEVYEPPPTWVSAVPRLKLDISALMELTCLENPPDVPIRAVEPNATYLVGDASGVGFGSTNWTQHDNFFVADYGTWHDSVTKDDSSNFREAGNLIIRTKALIRDGKLKTGSELFVFTDNSVAERTFYKGSSTSLKLHQMILELRKMEMEGQFIIHFIWISGKRMIAQGSDGLSRGDFSSGVMNGQHFLDQLPMDESALERQPALKNKLLACLPGNDWKFATTEDWFYQVFQEPNGKWIWSPPPALAKIAIEQMCEAKHIFPNSSHVFICPALWTGAWRKTLGKVADSMFSMSAGSYLWPTAMFEALTIAFLSPLLTSSPWSVRRSEHVDAWAAQMCSMQYQNRRSFRSKMREFWSKTTW